MDNIGTLKELGVKPGDVVAICGDEKEEKFTCVECPPRSKGYSYDDHWDFGIALFRDGMFRLISRAAETPKLWRDMTPEEKGTLLLAHHEGKIIESSVKGTRWDRCNPAWFGGLYYRIKPEPVVKEVVQLMYCGADGSPYIATDMSNPTHRIVFKTIGGMPDCSSIKMEKV